MESSDTRREKKTRGPASLGDAIESRAKAKRAEARAAFVMAVWKEKDVKDLADLAEVAGISGPEADGIVAEIDGIRADVARAQTRDERTREWQGLTAAAEALAKRNDAKIVALQAETDAARAAAEEAEAAYRTAVRAWSAVAGRIGSDLLPASVAPGEILAATQEERAQERQRAEKVRGEALRRLKAAGDALMSARTALSEKREKTGDDDPAVAGLKDDYRVANQEYVAAQRGVDALEPKA